ncbi:MAG: LamG-like jellyroll fold domain-containing protein [Nanoarchaeota archaeon]
MINHNTNLGISNYPFTISAWINYSGGGVETDGVVPVAELYQFGNTSFYGIGVNKSGRGLLYVRNSAAPGIVANGSSDLKNGFHHIAGVFVNSTKRELYIDGQKVGESLQLKTIALTPNNFEVGEGSTGRLGFFNGTIDEVAVWNRSLSKYEIKDLYRLKAGKYYWKVNLTDSYGNKNYSETREFTVNRENIRPSVIITSPINGSIYGIHNLSLFFNVTLNEYGGTVLYTLDNGINNKTMNTSDDINYFASNSTIKDGTYTLRIFANDTAGNRNDTESSIFTFDEGLIVNCRQLDIPGKTYKLLNNISSNPTCFTIVADNITLDGNGYMVNGNGAGNNDGVNVAPNLINITIKNLEVKGFSNGIIFGNNIIKSNIVSNFLYENSEGIHLDLSSKNLIRDNNIILNDIGIYLVFNSDNNTLINNTLNSNAGGSGEGVRIEASYNNTLKNNIINSNSQYGLSISSGNNNLVENNVLNGNGQDASGAGISLFNSNANNLTNNTVEANLYSGIRLSNSKYNSLINNKAKLNTNNLYIESISSSNNITGGLLNSSIGDSIILFSGSVENIFTNIIIFNTSNSFYDIKLSDAGLNGTTFVDMPSIRNYSFAGIGSKIIVKDSNFGEIRFLQPVNGSGGNLTRDIRIGSNRAEVRSDLNLGLNRSANISLYGLSTIPYLKQVIFRNGVACASGLCNNLTSLNLTNVTFNVTSWTNYSIGNSFGLVDCGFLNETNSVYILENDIVTTGTCFNVTANNVTLYGNGKKIDGDDGISDYGVSITTGFSNISIINLTIIDFGRGINIETGSDNDLIYNNSLDSTSQYGIYAIGSDNDLIMNNAITRSGSTATINLQGNCNNWTISGNSLGLTGIGVRNVGGSNNTIVNNYFYNLTGTGVLFSIGTSLNNLILNNTFYNNQFGVNLGATAVNILLVNNTLDLITSSGFVIRDNSANNTIIGGLINNSVGHAITIRDSGRNTTISSVNIKNTNTSRYDLFFETSGIRLANNTNLFDMDIGNYSFNDSFVMVKNSRFGEIKFIRGLNGTGTNLTRDVNIGNNSAEVRSDLNLGLNVSANVSLYGIGDRGFANPVIFRNGLNCPLSLCNNLTSLNLTNVIFNVSSWTNYSIGDKRFVPNVSAVFINSTLGTNKTKDDLNCFATLLDGNNDKINASVAWYNNSARHLAVDYNNSYANGTFFVTTLDNKNTTRGENWSCSLRLFDGILYSDWINSTNLNILNSLPNVTLNYPSDGQLITSRKPYFNWTSIDDDNDVLNYEFNLTKTGLGLCVDPRNVFPNGQASNYTLDNNLRCFYDNGDYYLWSVRVNDGSGFVNWTNVRSINLSSMVVVSAINNFVNFTFISHLDSDNTTDNVPGPFVLENFGNSIVNVSIHADDLWKTVRNPSQYYQFKVDNRSGFEGAFNWSSSITNFTFMPNSTFPLNAITGFNFENSLNRSEVDIYVQVPSGEGAGTRTSVVTFTSRLAEGG